MQVRRLFSCQMAFGFCVAAGVVLRSTKWRMTGVSAVALTLLRLVWRVKWSRADSGDHSVRSSGTQHLKITHRIQISPSYSRSEEHDEHTMTHDCEGLSEEAGECLSLWKLIIFRHDNRVEEIFHTSHLVLFIVRSSK